MKRNELKFAVLSACEDLKEASHPDVIMTWLDMMRNIWITKNNMKVCLHRYYKQGLLRRRKGKYSLSPRGQERLDYLRRIGA